MDISFNRGPAGEPGRGLIYQGLGEMDEGGSRNGVFLSEEAQYVGPLGRAPLLGTLEDMLRKALDMGISLHRGPIGEPGREAYIRLWVTKGPSMRPRCIKTIRSRTQYKSINQSENAL
jgi:hypothetical protein